MSFDYALEMKLAKDSPKLHRIFSDNVMCCQNILIKYKSLFPSYTDHTSLHSLEVISFCNELVGDFVKELNCDEIFILLMAAYLHDTGMGISKKDFDEFSGKIPGIAEYTKNHPDAEIDEVVREFHNEFSGKYIEKYKNLFDFPSEKHLFSVIQVSRGHRRTNLYDKDEYPENLILENGNPVRLPYLASLIRLADELDIAADRNIQFMYNVSLLPSEHSKREFKKHQAIKNVEFAESSLVVTVDRSDKDINPDLDRLFVKLGATLSECVKVVSDRTPFEIRQNKIETINI